VHTAVGGSFLKEEKTHRLFYFRVGSGISAEVLGHPRAIGSELEGAEM